MKAYDPTHRLTTAVGKAVKPAMPKGGQLDLPEVVVVAAFPRDVATLRVIAGTDHNSVSGEEEFWEVLVNGK